MPASLHHPNPYVQMYARAFEALSAEERALLRPAVDGIPKDEALASRSVFGHLF